MAVNEIPQNSVNMTPSGRRFFFASESIQASSPTGGTNRIAEIQAPPHAYLCGEIQVHTSDDDYVFVSIYNGSFADQPSAERIHVGRIQDVDNPAQAGLHKFPVIIPPGAYVSVWATVDGSGPYSMNAVMYGDVEWEPGFEPPGYY